MPLIIADRVLESSTTTGTGVFTLSGASLGFRAFASVCSVADTVWYYIEGVNSFGVPTGEYEYGLGTYSAANQLTRTTVRGSSNGGSPVNFTVGTKLVGISPMAPFNAQTRVEWRSALFGDTASFSAYLAASGGAAGNNTFSTVLYDTTIWNAGSGFTGGNFIAPMDGDYQFNAALQLSASTPGFLTIYKYTLATTTLAEYKRGAWNTNTGASQDFAVSGLVRMLAGDYVQIRVFHTYGSSLTPQGGSAVTWFDGHFVRGL